MDATHGQITKMENISSLSGSGNTAKEIRTIMTF